MNPKSEYEKVSDCDYLRETSACARGWTWPDTTDMLKREERRIRDCLKSHVSSYGRGTVDNRRVEHLIYRKPGSNVYLMMFVFDMWSQTVSVSGDVGFALVRPTWEVNLKSFLEPLELGYFQEKIECASRLDWQSHLMWLTALHDAAHELRDRL